MMVSALRRQDYRAECTVELVADGHIDRERTAPNQKRWHYPANFEGAVPDVDDVGLGYVLDLLLAS